MSDPKDVDVRQKVLDGLDRKLAYYAVAFLEAQHQKDVILALRLLRVDTERHMTGRTADEHWSWLSCIPCRWLDSGPVSEEGRRMCPVIRERAAVYARKEGK